jgi:hypothetical protein
MFMHFCQGKWCCSSVDSVGYPHVPDVPFSSSSSSLICSSLKSLVLVNTTDSQDLDFYALTMPYKNTILVTVWRQLGDVVAAEYRTWAGTLKQIPYGRSSIHVHHTSIIDVLSSPLNCGEGYGYFFVFVSEPRGKCVLFWLRFNAQVRCSVRWHVS